MEYIASHLVYWRRARLIAPLSPRDTYIVSPNADFSTISAATQVYAHRFPTLPTLPKVLSMLSGTPRAFRTFIPTTEHREAYMEILAWLMRGGWVTQLRTFAWVRVTPEIKAQVAAEMEREERIKKAEEARREIMSDNDSITGSLYSDNKRGSLLSVSTARSSTPLRMARRDRSAEGPFEEDMHHSTILSPRIPASGGPSYRGSPARTSSDAGSASSQRTTIALGSLQRPEPNSSRESLVSPTSPAPTSPAPSPKDFKPSVVYSPQKATSLEARWLEKIGQTFENVGTISTTNASPPKNADGGILGLTGKELRESWPTLLKHLDGRHAIEDVAPREGMKRKRVAALFNAIKERGWLVVVRHW
jgi:hypothetical protein